MKLKTALVPMIRSSMVLAALIATSAGANAQPLIDGGNVDAIISIARGYGSAALTSQGNGDPKISGRIAGMGYAIYFTGCVENRSCTEINFYAGFIDIKPTLDLINNWNSTKRYGRAYLDTDRDASIEMDINLEKGISRDNLVVNFETWRLVLDQFAVFTGFKQP